MDKTLKALKESAYKYWREQRPVFILVGGKAGTGKSTVASYLLEILPESVIYPFAQGVKETARLRFGWDGRKDDKGRRLLQNVGGIGREYNQDIWVSQVYDRVIASICKFAICDDWRFPNELAFLEKRDEVVVFTIRLDAPEREMLKGTPAYFDVSETSLPSDAEYYDYVIDNSGELELLYSKLDYIVSDIHKRIMED